MIAALFALALSQSAAHPHDLRLIQGDDEIVTWLDEAATEQHGTRVRTRVLRVRHPDQAFWVATEIDCAAGTQASLHVQNFDDGPLRPLEPSNSPIESGPHRPVRPYDVLGRALSAAICDGGARPFPWAPRLENAQAAVDALHEVRGRADAERPMAFVPAGVGHFALYLDRSTLQGGGPQWWVRTFQVAHPDFEAGGETYLGGWSKWEIDCGRETADRLDFASVRSNGEIGPTMEDDAPARRVAPGDEAFLLVQAVCDDQVWTRPALGSLEEAVADGRAALDF